MDTDWIDLTPTGFQLKSTNSNVNSDHAPYIYVAIRRADGWVAKPADAGTDVFAMDYGSGSTNIPTFDSGFPVDFGFYRIPTQAQDFTEGARLTGTKYLLTNATNSEADNAYHLWDSNLGWSKGHSSSYLSWMWKRGPGFDAVTYEGNSDSTRIIRHSLGAAPDMMWIKNRDASTNWLVGHHGLNEGTNPWNHYIYLNTSDASGEYDFFANKAPTAYSFEVSTAIANDTNNSYIALLFKSITGISKVGSYTGSGSGNTQTITTGFQPRFVIIKDYTGGSNPWYVLDTTRGWASGNDDILQLNDTAAALTGNDWGEPTATGFTVTGNGINLNTSSNKYIYYAHA